MMDTSEKYIKMCEKAEEIQKEWYPEVGDLITTLDSSTHFYLKRGIVINRGGRGMGSPSIDYYEDHSQVIYFDRVAAAFIWLPRQDQSLGMIEKKHNWFLLEDLTDFMLDNLLEDHGNVPYTPPPKEEWRDASMEQLCFLFVMHEKYQKTWDDGKEDWV